MATPPQKRHLKNTFLKYFALNYLLCKATVLHIDLHLIKNPDITQKEKQYCTRIFGILCITVTFAKAVLKEVNIRQ